MQFIRTYSSMYVLAAAGSFSSSMYVRAASVRASVGTPVRAVGAYVHR